MHLEVIPRTCMPLWPWPRHLQLTNINQWTRSLICIEPRACIAVVAGSWTLSSQSGLRGLLVHTLLIGCGQGSHGRAMQYYRIIHVQMELGPLRTTGTVSNALGSGGAPHVGCLWMEPLPKLNSMQGPVEWWLCTEVFTAVSSYSTAETTGETRV